MKLHDSWSFGLYVCLFEIKILLMYIFVRLLASNYRLTLVSFMTKNIVCMCPLCLFFILNTDCCAGLAYTPRVTSLAPPRPAVIPCWVGRPPYSQSNLSHPSCEISELQFIAQRLRRTDDTTLYCGGVFLICNNYGHGLWSLQC